MFCVEMFALLVLVCNITCLQITAYLSWKFPLDILFNYPKFPQQHFFPITYWLVRVAVNESWWREKWEFIFWQTFYFSLAPGGAFENRKILEVFPLDSGRECYVHNTFRRSPGRLLNVLCTYSCISSMIFFSRTYFNNFYSNSTPITVLFFPVIVSKMSCV